MAGTLGVTGLTTLSGGATVTGATNVNATGSGTTIIGSSSSATTALNSVATTVGGTLGVTGLTTLSGGVKTNTLTSTATTGALTIAGDQTSGGTVTIGTSSTATTLNGTTTASLSTTSAAVTQTTGTSGTSIATTAFVGNTAALKANIASPTFTGTVTIPAGAVITGYAPTSSPTFTGTVTIPAGAVITGYATTGDVNLKANIASPTFTGTVTIPAGAVITGYATTGDVNLKANIAGPQFNGLSGFTPTSNGNGNISNIYLSGCMTAPQADATQRRTADIVSGFSGPSHGTEYMAFGVGLDGIANNGWSSTLERMRISGGGRVGINTNNPSALLDVNGALVYSTAATRSDRRIKTDILDVEDQQALMDLRRLKPKTYGYKDSKERGNERVYGFIAQEVKEVLQYAGDLTKDYIPNIYEEVDIVNDILTFTTFNTSNLERDVSGEIFPKLKIKTTNLKNEYPTIVEVIDEHTLKVDMNSWSKDASGQLICTENTFVYGQEVNDFHNLNKDAIWTVATAALQEVDRQLQAEKQKTTSLQTAFDALLERVIALEQKSTV